MPRPAGVDLHKIFGPATPPDGWEQRADYHMFFVHGVSNAMACVGLRPTRKEIAPLCQRVASERQTSHWERSLRAATWPNFASLGQVNRFVEIQNLAFTTAASGVLAIELLLKDQGYSGDIYEERLCYVVPQDSHITELNHRSFANICAAASGAHNNKPWQACLEPIIHQSPELLIELVSGRLVTAGLAEEVLTVIKRFVPTFSGRVSNDFNARQKSLKQLRQAAYEAGGKVAQDKYCKKITGAQAERYPG